LKLLLVSIAVFFLFFSCGAYGPQVDSTLEITLDEEILSDTTEKITLLNYGSSSPKNIKPILLRNTGLNAIDYELKFTGENRSLLTFDRTVYQYGSTSNNYQYSGSLLPGREQEIIISYFPITSAGVYSTTLSVKTTAKVGNGVYPISIEPKLNSLTLKEYTLGMGTNIVSDYMANIEKQMYIENTGTNPVIIKNIYFLQDTLSEFIVTTSSGLFSTTLLPTEKLTIKITWTPITLVTADKVIMVDIKDLDSILNVELGSITCLLSGDNYNSLSTLYSDCRIIYVQNSPLSLYTRLTTVTTEMTSITFPFTAGQVILTSFDYAVMAMTDTDVSSFTISLNDIGSYSFSSFATSKRDNFIFKSIVGSFPVPTSISSTKVNITITSGDYSCSIKNTKIMVGTLK
jgi:hypothetical protein